MKVVGITGGVGAGKSQILKILKEEYDAQVIEADRVAKELEEPGNVGYLRLVEALGPNILCQDKTIDRKALANLIFRDEAVLRQVNQIIHPLTWHAIADIIHESRKKLVVVEAALFDKHNSQTCDEIWFADTSLENRLERLMSKRGYSLEKCQMIMNNQPTRDDFLAIADHVIDNNRTMDEVRCQINAILGAKEQSKDYTNEIN